MIYTSILFKNRWKQINTDVSRKRIHDSTHEGNKTEPTTSKRHSVTIYSLKVTDPATQEATFSIDDHNNKPLDTRRALAHPSPSPKRID